MIVFCSLVVVDIRIQYLLMVNCVIEKSLIYRGIGGLE